MNNMERKQITDVVYKINDKQIMITSDNANTTFINFSYNRLNYSFSEVIVSIDKLRRLAKEKSVKLSGALLMKKWFETNWNGIINEYISYKKIFDSLKKIAKKIEKHGIFQGYADDELMQELDDNLIKADASNFPLMCDARAKYERIKAAITNLEREEEIIKINIF